MAVLHSCTLLCFSFKNNQVASGSWAVREADTLNYQWIPSPSSSPPTSFLQELFSWPDRKFLLFPGENNLVYFHMNMPASIHVLTTVQVIWCSCLQERHRESLTNSIHIPRGRQWKCCGKVLSTPLLFSGRRICGSQGKIMCRYEAGDGTVRIFQIHLVLGWASSIPFTNKSTSRPEEDTSALLAN